MLNLFVQHVREQMDSSNVKHAIRNRGKKSRLNLKSCRKLINQYFNTFSKLLIIRIDFAFKPPEESLCPPYPKELEHPFHSENALQLLKNYIAQFLRNRRHNKILNQIKGYILKFEHGLKKGFHVHAIFIMDGNIHHKDGYFADELTKYWKNLTNGEGCTYNCHMAKDKYKKVCIGIINYTDEAKRQALDTCIQYFCKKDQYFMFNKMNRNKTLQLSQPPQKRSKAGRPRKFENTVNKNCLKLSD